MDPEVSEAGRQPHMERVTVADGVSLAVRAWEPDSSSGAGAGAGAGTGTGAPLVLLHGIAGTAAGWDAVARRLAASGRRAYAVDFRGHGESDRPDGGYDLATLGLDLAALVAGLGLERPVIVGHSLGAWAILKAIADGHVDAGGIGLVEGGLVDASAQFPSFAEAMDRLALPPVGGMPVARLEGYLRQANPGWSSERLAAAFSAFDVASDGTVSWRLTGPRFDALIRALWEARVSDWWPSLNTVPPTRALAVVADTGDTAWTAAKRDADSRLRARVPGLRVEWLGTDHEVHLDRPERVAALLLEAFAST